MDYPPEISTLAERFVHQLPQNGGLVLSSSTIRMYSPAREMVHQFGAPLARIGNQIERTTAVKSIVALRKWTISALGTSADVIQPYVQKKHAWLSDSHFMIASSRDYLTWKRDTDHQSLGLEVLFQRHPSSSSYSSWPGRRSIVSSPS